jgi:O-antigen/teichoic acid export membrane protein
MARKRNRVLMYTQLLPTLAGIGLVVAGTRVFGIFGAAWAILLTNVAIQASRRLAARRLGYRGVAERRFAEALLLFGGLWLADNMLALSVAVEAVACLILVPGVVLRFDLIGEMKHVLSARAGQCAAE